MLGVAFAIRPVVWPVAVAWLLVDAWPRRNRWQQVRMAALRLLVFGLLLVPHGLSNAIRHGHCSPLPLDGSEPYLHLAYWQHLLPGEYDNHLWQGTYMGHELLPLAAPADLDGNRRAYAEDWALVERACDPLLTDGDRRRLAAMDSIPGLFRTWPAAYVLARRKALMQRLLVRIQERPCYYLLSRVYSGLRLWVTGFSVKSWRQPGWKAKAAALYPMLVTLVVLGVGWLVIAWSLLTRRLPWKPVRAILLVCLTYWGVHLVMPIQSRYTVPLHLPVLVLVSFALASFWLQLKPADGPQPSAEPEKTG